ncbi:MAG TPA: hypothetical protein VGL89_17380 [Candidatus Koribacter sp.]|jgi:hypothetical protein
MKKVLLVSTILACSATLAFAQGQRAMVLSGDGPQMGGAITLELDGPDSDTRPPVKNNPITADIVNSHVQYLSDGNKISNEETSHFYRDSEGRTRRENKLMLPGHEGDSPSMIVISDPVAHTKFVLNTMRKSANEFSTVVDGGPASDKVMFFAKTAGDGAKAGGSDDAMFIRKRTDERIVNAPGPDSDPETMEDLGTQTIGGFSAHGTRSSHTIPAGRIGNERPITVTTETWYSDDIGMEVKRVHKDPWVGEMTTKVENVRRGEPDASLFTPPADYKVQTMKGDHRIIRLETKDGELPPPPPPPPQN